MQSNCETEDRLIVQTVAGCGRMGSSDGLANRAMFAGPYDCIPLLDGSLMISDCLNNSLRRVHSKAGRVVVETIASKTPWLSPRGLALSVDGTVLVCDSGHHRIRCLALQDGRITTFAGNGLKGHRDGPAERAKFDTPSDVFMCTDGTILVADSGNRCIRTISRIEVRSFHEVHVPNRTLRPRPPLNRCS